MPVRIEKNKNLTTAFLSGEIDHHSSAFLREEIDKAVNDNSDFRGRKRLSIAYRLDLLTRSIIKRGGKALGGVKVSYDLYHDLFLLFKT